jgi:SAM-dependent methyltransferase
MAHLLFSYGTLQLPAVQIATFGHELVGEPDAIVGHRVEDTLIEDPRVVELSGAAIHPVLVPETGAAYVEGRVYELDDTALAAADDYEVSVYDRVAVRLRSGRTAWVYVLAPRESSRAADGSAGDADYGVIGTGYRSHRRPDPQIAARLHEALGSARSVINVGAGAGSYEPRDRAVTAVEPAASMRAQRPDDLARAIDAVAERLPFADGSFDAAMATFTVHQWPDLAAGLAEVRRVTRGPVVVLTCDPQLLSRSWLAAYAPEVIEVEAGRYPPTHEILEALGGGEVIPVPIPLQCTDGFGEAYYGRPERLLDAGARLANSAWSFVGQDVQDRFVERLSRDLADGTWDAVHGHLRVQEVFEGSLTLVVARGAAEPSKKPPAPNVS